MKITVVPAQITTVEDKVAGILSLSQLVLIITPVFLSGLIYAAAPPSFGFAIYKLAIMGLLFLAISSLAIRVKGQLLIIWLIILFKYNSRPLYYVFDKNDSYLRDNDNLPIKKVVKKKAVLSVSRSVAGSEPPIAFSDKARLEAIIANPSAKLAFKISRKGGLDVYITEVE